MSILQGVLLWAMISCTPSLIFLACLLWKPPLIQSYVEGAPSSPPGRSGHRRYLLALENARPECWREHREESRSQNPAVNSHG
jgi:hypothetical protein